MEVLQSQLEWTYTYYAHDANGQLMGIYKHEFDEGSGTNAYVLNSTSLGNPIYGSDRLGMHQSDLVESFNFSGQELNGEIVATGSNYTAISSPVNTNFAREVGKRAYELKNHLGNVLVTVSDRKVASGNTGLIDSYTADVLSYSDYYPFGMQMPGRKANSSEYSFGFQGQLKDDEIKGEENSVNYKYRMHDPRLGRFFAVDPLAAEYPFYTPYSFSGNRVIDAVEVDGLHPLALAVAAAELTGLSIITYYMLDKKIKELKEENNSSYPYSRFSAEAIAARKEKVEPSHYIEPLVFDVDLRPEFSAPEVAEDPVIVETYLIGNENYPGDWSYDRPNDYIPRTPNGIGPENMPNGGPKVFWAIYLMYSAYSKYQSQIKQAEKAYKKPALEQQRLTPIDKETFQKFLLYLEQSSWDQDKKDRVKEIDDLILEYKEQQRSNSREQK